MAKKTILRPGRWVADGPLDAGRYVADGYPVEAGFYWVGYMAGGREVFDPPYASWRPYPDGSWGSYTDTLGPFATKRDAEEAARRPHGDPELRLRLAKRPRSKHVLTDWHGASFPGELTLVRTRQFQYVGGRYVGPYTVYYWRYELDGRVYHGRNTGCCTAIRLRAGAH